MVAYDESHTNLNRRNYAHPHEPTRDRARLPQGIVHAAMIREPEEWRDKSPWQKAMLRSDYERALRNPPHTRQRIHQDFWETPSSYPLHTPRRQDFRSDMHWHHALRDFALEVHANQLSGHEARKIARPHHRPF